MPLRDAPAAAGALDDFPDLATAGAWHRVWRSELPDGSRRDSPWWFASIPANPEDGGRFDLPEPAGGACYLASSPIAAVLEALQDQLRLLPLAELKIRRRVTIDAPSSAPAAADATAPAATGFGVTAGLWATPDREKTQGWALAFRRDGWWALHTGVHHDVTSTHRALALFDSLPGQHPPSHPGDWDTSSPTTLHDDPDLLDELESHGCSPVGPANLPRATHPPT